MVKTFNSQGDDGISQITPSTNEDGISEITPSPDETGALNTCKTSKKEDGYAKAGAEASVATETLKTDLVVANTLDESDADPSRPYGNLVVEVDGKKFYNAIQKKTDVIQVGDSVDIVQNFLSPESRLTSVAKIASIFQDSDGELKAEVAFYYDANDNIPTRRRSGPNNTNESQWKGFTHHNEVVASNKFEIVDVDAFDETVWVHSNLEEYQEAINRTDDEIANTFCLAMCYTESFTVKPFDVKTEWKRIMLEYSQYHRIYHTEDESITAATKEVALIGEEIIIGRMSFREEEAAKIRTFIETGIKQGGTGQLLYVSGVPGTGKTATVNMIVRSLSEKKMKGKLPWFDLIEINGVHLVDPNDFYRTLYTKLMKKPAPNHMTSYQLLDEYFTSNTTPCVLIIDEADYIVTKRQKVLFTIFDWPSRKSSKLIVVIISNTMDLPSKMKASCVSRLAFGTLVFHPYRYHQILDVIKAKMGNDAPIDDVALQLCARRVTNYNGDMRKAIQICKLALAQSKNGRITTAVMNKVSNSVLSSAVVDALQQVSTATSCLLVALVLELKETQLSVACARRVYYAFKGMMSVVRPEMENNLSIEAYRKLLVSAAQSGIISLEPTVFTSVNNKRKMTVYEELSEDLGDTGIVPEVDVGQIVTALSRDPYWERKLRDL